MSKRLYMDNEKTNHNPGLQSNKTTFLFWKCPLANFNYRKKYFHKSYYNILRGLIRVKSVLWFFPFQKQVKIFLLPDAQNKTLKRELIRSWLSNCLASPSWWILQWEVRGKARATPIFMHGRSHTCTYVYTDVQVVSTRCNHRARAIHHYTYTRTKNINRGIWIAQEVHHIGYKRGQVDSSPSFISPVARIQIKPIKSDQAVRINNMYT